MPISGSSDIYELPESVDERMTVEVSVVRTIQDIVDEVSTMTQKQRRVIIRVDNQHVLIYGEIPQILPLTPGHLPSLTYD